MHGAPAVPSVHVHPASFIQRRHGTRNVCSARLAVASRRALSIPSACRHHGSLCAVPAHPWAPHVCVGPQQRQLNGCVVAQCRGKHLGAVRSALCSAAAELALRVMISLPVVCSCAFVAQAAFLGCGRVCACIAASAQKQPAESVLRAVMLSSHA
jgi:hypothetical protein